MIYISVNIYNLFMIKKTLNLVQKTFLLYALTCFSCSKEQFNSIDTNGYFYNIEGTRVAYSATNGLLAVVNNDSTKIYLCPNPDNDFNFDHLPIAVYDTKTKTINEILDKDHADYKKIENNFTFFTSTLENGYFRNLHKKSGKIPKGDDLELFLR
jgi:hypothetical protein